MQLKAALESAVRRLEESDVPSPRLNAELLFRFVLDCDRAYLFAHSERELSQDEQLRYDEVLAERARHKPTQYITGHQEFWGLDFLVTPAVLIPRPETEHLVETVLELARGLDCPRIVDVGAGSGCVALALAHALPQADIQGVDIAPEAVEVARANAARLQLERVRFSVSDLLASVSGRDFDFVVSNPPYVGELEPEKVQRQVREFEPKIAVFAGPHGLDIYQRLIPQAHAALKPGGWLATEIGFSIEEPVRALLSAFSEIRTVPDLQGIPRVLAARK